MKITVLGSRGAYPSQKNGTSAYLLQTSSGDFLIDCGSGALAGLEKISSYDRLRGIVLSHLHADHACELPLIAYAKGQMDLSEALPVYLPVIPTELKNNPAFDFHLIADETIDLQPGLRLRSFPAIHPVPGVMIRMMNETGVIAYSGDTVMCDALLQCAENADIFICNAAFPNSELGEAQHVGSKHAAMTADHARAGCLWLTHVMPKASADAMLAEASAIFKPVHIPKPFDFFEIA